MGMPEIVVSFQEAARTLMRRSERGIVAMILKDGADDMLKITSADSAKKYFTEKNTGYITMALDAGARAVIAVKLQGDMEKTLDLIYSQTFNWLVYPEADSTEAAALVTWIKDARKNGKTFKAVVAGVEAPNCEAVVNFATTGITDAAGAVESGAYCAKLAGLFSGLPLNMSATYYEDVDITGIEESEDKDAAVDAGKLILFYDREKFRIARAVTSLTSRPGVSNEFKKIKHVEGADMIAQDVRTVFEDEFIGKIANSYDNKQLFVAMVNNYLQTLEGSVLDPDFDNLCAIDEAAQRAYIEKLGISTLDMDETEILKYNTDSAVFLRMDIKFLDAMEDLVLNVYIN